LLPEQEPEQLKSNGVAELVENSQGVRGFVPLPPRRMMIENFVPISTSIQCIVNEGFTHFSPMQLPVVNFIRNGQMPFTIPVLPRRDTGRDVIGNGYLAPLWRVNRNNMPMERTTHKVRHRVTECCPNQVWI